ncbi:Aste57867_13075 [Aphanomyces stellatus]|uniref:Aste57867_13075 protein n=1 Tax=Aphanomyces stellatus TaxID=120398 RepID=A0A485KX75_9STRA|nr:hypothetical protein As57867_013027 [Aphanomyces stellatus]VFT89919.1 Aste57867_13075 [Aphanomyces stellatus]
MIIGNGAFDTPPKERTKMASMTGLSAFLTATGALPPAGMPSNIISERKTILSAFETLDLELQKGPNGEMVVKSSARDLMDQRKHEKAQEALYEQKAELAKQAQPKKPVVETALTQAMASFASETDEFYVPKAAGPTQTKKGGRNVSSRARHRQEMNKEKMENYSNKVKTKSSMQVKRLERKEKYKRVY